MVERLARDPNEISLTQAESLADIDEARTLFKEYEASLDITLCFQSFEQELANLPGDYAPPSGLLVLARIGGDLAGCIALRRLEDGACEMKRLYLRPELRGTGLGKKMLETILAEARQIGYSKMRLDTLPGRMDKAIKLYRSIGFKEISPYYNNPASEALYMELDLNL
jgi:ribosomal protein S18 acetylase RimI-like enzyme